MLTITANTARWGTKAEGKHASRIDFHNHAALLFWYGHLGQQAPFQQHRLSLMAKMSGRLLWNFTCSSATCCFHRRFKPGCSACTSFHGDSSGESSARASLLRLCLVLFVWPEVTFKWGFVGNTCHWGPQAMLTVAKSHRCNEFVRAALITLARF